MAASVFAFDVVITLLLSGSLLFNYGNRMRHRILVTLAVLIAWYFSFLIIFILPLDVSSTAYRQCVNASITAYVKTLNHTVPHDNSRCLSKNCLTFTLPSTTS